MRSIMLAIAAVCLLAAPLSQKARAAENQTAKEKAERVYNLESVLMRAMTRYVLLSGNDPDQIKWTVQKAQEGQPDQLHMDTPRTTFTGPSGDPHDGGTTTPGERTTFKLEPFGTLTFHV